MIATLRAGFAHQRLARLAARDGMELDVSALPRRPSGRIERDAADALFDTVRAELDSDPDDWRRWYRLARAYDYAGDRGRAREAMKQASELHRALQDANEQDAVGHSSHARPRTTQEMFEAVLAGATDPEIEGVDVVRRPALTVSSTDVLEADGYLLGTPANLGYMSGALKHAFDVCYYPAWTPRSGRPFGLYLHGNEGTEGAERGVDAITTGLGWVKAAEYRGGVGQADKADLEACWELGATVAAQLMD